MNNCSSVKYNGCCGSRNFLTKEEKGKLLKDYKESLESEAQAVQEKIDELKT